MSSALERLGLKGGKLPKKPAQARVEEPAEQPQASALARLGLKVPRGTSRDTLDRVPDVKPTAAVAEGVTRGAPRPSAPDPLNTAVSAGVQAVATPLERTLNALTAPWRMGASAAGEATGAFPKSGNAAVAGLKEPGRTYSAVAGHLAEQVPDEQLDIPSDFPGDAPTHRAVPLRSAVKGAGIATDFADPIMLASFGGVTEAGQLYRAAKIGHEAALLERAGALTAEEAAVAQQKVDAAAATLAQVIPQLKREGTLASNGRALVSIGGRTAPPLAAGGGLGAAEGVLAKVGRTRLARGVSGLFQPPEKRVSDAIRARSYAVKASGDVAAREAVRGLKDLTDEYPDLLKALGGDRQAFDDALSLAHERSQGKRFDVPSDWLTKTERDAYWGTTDEAEQKALEAVGQKRARAALPQFLPPKDAGRLRQLEREGRVRKTQSMVLGAPEDEGARLVSQMSPEEQAAHASALRDERKRIGDITYERAKRDTPMLVGEAQRRFGNWVSADNARDLFPEYAANKATRSLHAASVHEGSSVVTKAWYKDELAKPPRTGVVLVTGGGPGSGKTTGLPTGIRDHVDVVYDAASGRGTEDAVKQAIASGRRVDFFYTYRPPHESWAEGVLPRAVKTGRTVPGPLAAKAHSEGIKNTRAIIENLQPELKSGQLKFHLVDNSHGIDNVVRYDGDAAKKFLYDLPVPNEEALREDFLRETERQAAEGRIPHRVYAASVLDPLNDPAARVAGGGGAVAGAGGSGGGDLEAARAGGLAPGGRGAVGRKSAADLAQQMSEMRATKPRPLAKLFGKVGPTPAQKTVYDAELKRWASDYRRLEKAQKAALERDNAEYAARRAVPQALAPARSSTEISQGAFQREQAAVDQRLQKLAVDHAAAKTETDAIVARAQDRAHLQALNNSIQSARRMYFRGAAPAVAQRFGDYAPKMIDRLNVRNASMFSNTVREGVKLNELVDPQAYLMHAATPEFQQSILDHARESGMAEKGMGWREFSEKHGAQLTRKLRMTAVEANELGAQGRLAANGYKPVKQAFYTNPFIAQVMREQAGGHAQGVARFIRELANTYGHKIGTGPTPRGWRTVPNNIEGIGDKVAFSPEIADLLGKHLEQLKDPGHIVQAYDRLNQIWKQWTLGIFPVYHTRNEIGDLSNALLGGLDVSWAGPAIGEVLSGTRLGQKAAGKGITFEDGRHFAPGALRDEAENMGVVQSGQLQQEIEKRVLGPLADPDAGGLPFAPAFKRIKRAVSEAGAGETGGRKLGSKVGAGLHAAQRQLTDNRAVDAALTVGNIREQALRMALYIDRRSRGWSPEAASLWVRKHLIDYGQMSQHENETMRRVFPFYTWTRHNAPLQLEYLFAKPGNFATLQHARQTAADNQDLGVGDEPLPQFLSEGLPIRTGTSAEGNPEFWRLDGTLPMSDALLPLSPVIDPAAGVRRASSLLSWVPQEVAEQVSDSDWYRSMVGKNVPITEWEGQQGSFLGMPMNKRVIHALSNARVLTELNRLNPGDVFGTDKQPAYGGLGSVRERPDLDPAQRWLNLFLGRGYAVDEARNADDWHRAVKHQLDLLESEIRRDEAQGKTAQASAARRRYERILEHPEEISPDMAH